MSFSQTVTFTGIKLFIMKLKHAKLYCINNMLRALLVLSILLLPFNAWSFNHAPLSDNANHASVSVVDSDVLSHPNPCHSQVNSSAVSDHVNKHDCCVESVMILQCDACGSDCANAKYPINYQSDWYETSSIHSPLVDATTDLTITPNPTLPYRPPPA